MRFSWLRSRVVTHLLLVLGAFVMLYPLLWMVSSSFKPDTIIFQEKGLIPSVVTLDNYTYGWTALREPFTTFFINSLLLSLVVIIGNVFSCTLTGYAFARLKFKFKRVWFALMLATLMLPVHAVLVPRYILFNELGWVGTYLPLSVPKFFAVDAFFVFLSVQFIRGIPVDLDQAAEVDGANKYQIFMYIIFPLSLPAVITTAVFTFIWTWKDFFSQLLYLSNDIDLYTVPLGLRAFMDSTGSTSFGPLMAMSVLALVPTFIIFVVAQRYLVEGISTTGFKG